MLIFLSLFAFFVLGVVAIDAIPMLSRWVQRIHIGRHASSALWRADMARVASRWLRRMPTLPLGDHRRLTVLDRLAGRYSSNVLQSWQEAALLLGTGAFLGDNSGDDERSRSLALWLEQRFNEDGSWKQAPQQVDEAMLCYALLKLPNIDVSHYRPACETVRELLFSMKQDDGTIPYRRFQANIRYVDTVGFVCPFLVAYGVVFNDEKSVDLAFKQIQQFSATAMLPDSQIPAHAFDVEHGVPLGIYGWGRGIAWYALGLMGMREHLPKEDQRREELRSWAAVLADNLLQYQQSNGGWGAMATLASSSTDSSATAVLGRFLFRVGKELDCSDYLSGAARSLAYLKSVTRKNGVVDFSQGDTKGIGRYSSRFEQMPFTQGMSLLFAMEFEEKGGE